MIKITRKNGTKNSTVILSEEKVFSAQFYTSSKEVWVKILMPDGGWMSDRYDHATSMEYIPNNEHIII